MDKNFLNEETTLEKLLVEDEKALKLERERGNKEKQKQRMINGFKEILGKENLIYIFKLLETDRTKFTDDIIELFNSSEKLLKNSKEDSGSNRNFLSELNKNLIYKDSSKLQEKILFYLYKDLEKYLSIDYMGVIRWKKTSTDILSVMDIENKIPKYILTVASLVEIIRILNEKKRLLIFPKNLSEDLKEHYENYKKNIEIDIKKLEKKLEEYFYKVKLEIISTKEQKIKTYKFLFFFLQLYQNINENIGYLRVMEELKKIDLPPIVSDEVETLSNLSIEELKMYLKNENKKNKRITIEESYLSIDVFYKTVIKNYERINDIEAKLLNIIYIAFFKGIYLSQISYKRKKLYSYIDNHRKSEFILCVYDHLEADRKVTKKILEFFFTEKEIKVYSKKALENENILPKNKVEFESMKVEDKFLPKIIRIILDDRQELQELRKITNYYVDIKKKHGKFINNKTLYMDVKLIIDAIFQVYFTSYLNYDLYQQLKENINEVINYEEKEVLQLKEWLSLKNK